MPRIRKKTSKRGTTHQREKIKHKASETRKKNKKGAKQNPQWKSKHHKDPGIPNNFPFKDQILAEIAEERRQAEEEKQRRKEAKKASKAASKAASEDLGEDVPQSTLHEEPLYPKEPPTPVLINRDLRSLGAVIDRADVVIEVVDVRDPQPSRSTFLEDFVKAKADKRLLIVLNKIDLCPRETTESWISSIIPEVPVVPFRAASAFLPTAAAISPGKGKQKESASDAVGVTLIMEKLEEWVSSSTKEELVVAVVGITNVGKSSFINSLVRQAAFEIYSLPSSSSDSPSTTVHPQETTFSVAEKQVRIIDTPGLTFLAPPDHLNESDLRTNDILLRSRGRVDRLKDPIPAVTEIVRRAVQEDLILFYSLPYFPQGNVDAFLAGVARLNGMVKKGGTPDLTTASRVVLRDWATGKFPRYTLPSSLPSRAAIPESHRAVLSTLRTRQEMRKDPGIVKLICGEIEQRAVDLDADYWASNEAGDESSEHEEDEESAVGSADSEDDTEESDAVSDEEDVDMDEDGHDDEDVASPPMKGKRKRMLKNPSVPERPTKKVSFAAMPKNTKQARSSAGARSAPPKGIANGTKASALKAKPIRPPKAQSPTKSAKSQVSDGAEGGDYDFSKFFSMSK